MSVDRSAKNLLERMVKMVPLRSDACARGHHQGCDGAFDVLAPGVGPADRDESSARGVDFIPDTVGARCSCPCHD